MNLTQNTEHRPLSTLTPNTEHRNTDFKLISRPWTPITTIPETTTPTMPTWKHAEIDNIFQPDPKGVSQWVSRETLDASVLNWGNNGAQRHGIFFGDKRYMWEKQGKSKITALRTVGFSEDELYGATRPIREDIKQFYKQQGCVVCGSHSDLVTDHKNDLYNDPRVLSRVTQTLDDFQCLCNHCNLQKRQVAKTTLETGVRFAATNIPSLAPHGIDFIQGDDTFDPADPNAMVGTFWYDVVAFHQHLHNPH